MFNKWRVLPRSHFLRKGGGDIGLLIDLVPKVLIVDSKTLGTFTEFWLVCLKLVVSNVLIIHFNLQKRYSCIFSLGLYINLSSIVLSLNIHAFWLNDNNKRNNNPKLLHFLKRSFSIIWVSLSVMDCSYWIESTNSPQPPHFFLGVIKISNWMVMVPFPKIVINYPMT